MKLFTSLGIIAVLWSSASLAIDFDQLKQAEKISLSLTGKPMSDPLRARFVSGQLKLEDLAEELTKSSEFIERFAGFWTRLLGIQSPFNVNALVSTDTKRSIYSKLEGRTWLGIGFENTSYQNKEWVEGVYNYRANGPIELWTNMCDDGPLIVYRRSGDFIGMFRKAAEQGLGTDGLPIKEGTQPAWKKLLDLAVATEAKCDDKTVVNVKPWWDPDKVTVNGKYNSTHQYRTPQKIIDICGKNLEKCSTVSQSDSNSFMNTVNHDFAMEPGYLIAHTVAEDKPFSDILTTPKTVMTGTSGYFMATWGSELWSNFPNGGFTEATHSIFQSPNILDRKHYWINRNNLNAGVLTTPAFQLVTNGRRAKVNRAYESFLCRKFVVPEGAKADPSDANPDLTKRAYCSYCHKSIEPMAAFFNRWPQTGVANFIYNKESSIDDTGRFAGQAGKGAAAFGQILATDPSFVDCSIHRAFEFVNGRKMTQQESYNRMPAYEESFEASEKNLRKIIKSMVLSPDFLNPKGANE